MKQGIIRLSIGVIGLGLGLLAIGWATRGFPLLQVGGTVFFLVVVGISAIMAYKQEGKKPNQPE